MNILLEAHAVVDQTRQDDYGDPVINAVRQAIIMTAVRGKTFTPSDITATMLTVKLARSVKYKHDTNVDLAGYADINERVQAAEESGLTTVIARRLLAGLL